MSSPRFVTLDQDVLQPTRSIAKVQRYSGYTKQSQVDPRTQQAIGHLPFSNDSIEPAPHTPPKGIQRPPKRLQTFLLLFIATLGKLIPFLIRRSFAYFETLIPNNVLPAQGMDNAEALNALVSGLSKKCDTLRSELDNLAVIAKEPSACKVVFSPSFVLKTNQR